VARSKSDRGNVSGPGPVPGRDSQGGAEDGLARESVGFSRTAAQSVASTAPVAGIALVPATLAGVAGESGPLSFALGAFVGLLLAYVFVRLSHHVTTAGGLSAYAGMIYGGRVALGVAWLYVVGDLVLNAGVIWQAADYLQTSIDSIAGVVVPALVLTLVVWAVTTFIVSRRVSVSTALLLAAEGVSLLIITVLGIVVLAHGGYHGTRFGFHYFSPSGVSANSLALGVAISFIGYAGFESTAALAEETVDARVTVGRTMVVGLIVSGVAYTFGSWFESVGFKNSAALAASPTPLFTLAHSYGGAWLSDLLAVFATLSAIGTLVAGGILITRTLHATSRNHLRRSPIRSIDSSNGVPKTAVAIWSLLILVVFVPVAGLGAARAFGYLATIGALVYTVAYLTVCAGAILWLGRRSIQAGLIAACATAALGYELYSSVYPVPPSPLNYFPYIAGAIVLVGIAITIASSRASSLSTTPPPTTTQEEALEAASRNR
jgi:amino acid transporter